MATTRKGTNLGNQHGRESEIGGQTERQGGMKGRTERGKTKASLDSARVSEHLNRGNKLPESGNKLQESDKSPEKWTYDESEYEDE